MTILKLKEVGDEATLEITGVSYVEGQYGPQLKFEAGEDVLYLPVFSAERQLERIGINDYAATVGQTLHFSRTASNKPGASPFWNINTTRKNGATKPAAPPPKPAVMASKPNAELHPLLQNQEEEDAAELQAKVGIDLTKFSKDLALYTALTEFVTKDIAPIHVKGGIGMSPESAVAAVATLYIQAKKTA